MLESLEIRIAEPIENYKYEWISAVAHYAVDPDDPAPRIADLALVPREQTGKVRFTGESSSSAPPTAPSGRAHLVRAEPRKLPAFLFSGFGDRAGRVGPSHRPETATCLTDGWTIAYPAGSGMCLETSGCVGLDAPVADVEPGWLRADLRIDGPGRGAPAQ